MSSLSSINVLDGKLNKHQSFLLTTGNINNYSELKFQRFTNSAEELKACLELQFSKLPPEAKISESGVLTLAENKCCTDKESADEYHRDDLKITLKLFLEKFDFNDVKAALDSVLSQLGTQTIEQLIFAFPPKKEMSDEEWYSNVLRIWNETEKSLICGGRILSMGVADFTLDQLDRLYKDSTTKLSVLHFNIEGCCQVPPELQSFATEKDIQLLTHNDPNPFPLIDVFCNFCNVPEPSPLCSFKPAWAARYTVWVRRRSLMVNKGYLLYLNRDI